MSVKLVCGNITKISADAIVNAANSTLLGGAGVDGAIHRAAGPFLLAECRTIGWCSPGDAKITKGYDLPARHVIHTVGPIWHGGTCGERETLENCYTNSMKLAIENGLKSIAFPLISAGVYGYPKEQAIRVALETLGKFADEDTDITLVLFDEDKYSLAVKIASEM